MANSLKRTHRTPQQWQRLITEFEAGDQGPEEFCRNRQLPSTTFYKWRKKFRDGETAVGNGSAGPSLVDFVELPPVSPKASPAAPVPTPASASDGPWRGHGPSPASSGNPVLPPPVKPPVGPRPPRRGRPAGSPDGRERPRRVGSRHWHWGATGSTVAPGPGPAPRKAPRPH